MRKSWLVLLTLLVVAGVGVLGAVPGGGVAVEVAAVVEVPAETVLQDGVVELPVVELDTKLRFWSCQDCYDAYSNCLNTSTPAAQCEALRSACLARLGCS